MFGDGIQVVESSLVVAALRNDGVLVHDGFGVLEVGLGGGRLQGVFVGGQDLLGLGKVTCEVVGNSQGSPVLAYLRPGLQHGGTTLYIALVVAHLDLKKGEVSLDLLRLGLQPQGELISLDGLLEVLLVTVKQTVNMPTDVRLHIGSQCLLSQCEGLLGLALLVQDQGLHGHGVAMLRVLLEDLLGGLETPLVLLVFIVADDLSEERTLLRTERLWHGRKDTRIRGEEKGNPR